jgi:dinuclear metal center YbgI/SA1388 family protein
MSIKIKDIASFIEDFAPLNIAEEWDNVGLLLGSMNSEVKRAMVCLDATSKIINEAIEKKAGMIITHHPFIFKGLKRIDTDSYLGKSILKLMKNEVSVYSAHTNLDMAVGGVNQCLAEAIGINELRDIKRYKAENLFKIVVFVPQNSIEIVRDSMSKAGAGWIGNYRDCFFSTLGEGTFKPLEDTNPYIGSIGKLERVDEFRLETVVAEKGLKGVIAAMKKAHPYEEVAYDLYPLKISGKEYGLGKIGVLRHSVYINEFISLIKNKLNTPTIRIIGNTDRLINKVAVFCGSFDESLIGLIKNNSDILVTGDVKYHTAQDLLENEICTIDAGHFNTEFIIVDSLINQLKDTFPSIEFFGSDSEKDPFNYI